MDADVISQLLAGLDGAYSSLGHQPKSCTMSEKCLASQQLHTRKMSLSFSLPGVTILAAVKAFCKGFLMTFQLPRQPQQASDLSGKSPFSSCLGKSLSQPFSKCGLVASASPRTVRSKNLQPWRLYLGHSNLCFKKSSRGSPRMLKIKNPKSFNTYSKLKEQHMPKV